MQGVSRISMLLALVIPCLICPNPTWQDLTRRVDHVTIRRSLDSGSTVPPGPDLVSEAFHLMRPCQGGVPGRLSEF